MTGEPGKLTKAQQHVLLCARDRGYAFAAILDGHSPQKVRRIGEAISLLMDRDLLHQVPGPRWATITPAGRSALSSGEEGK